MQVNAALTKLLHLCWTVCKALMVHAAPANWTMKDTCATAGAVLTPSALPANDHKSVGADGGEPEDGFWFPDPFDSGGDPDGILEVLALPCAIRWSHVVVSS